MENFDCRHFRGDKPCAFSQGGLCGPYGETGSCRHYTPIGPKILIIKLGALGDVLRTTTLLPAIEKEFPGGSVVWLTKPGAIPLLEGAGSPETLTAGSRGGGVWKILPWDLDSVLWAERLDWDMVISLDKEEGPTTLAEKVKSARKHGFGRNIHGLLRPLGESSEYLFRLGIDNREKFEVNLKTYPQLIAEACRLPWGPNRYVLNLTQEEIDWAESQAKEWGDGPLIGLNPGSGEAFAGKKWPIERYVKVAEDLRAEGMVPVFLGGASEKQDYLKLRNQAWEYAVFPGCEFPLRRFMALVSRLRVLISGDTLAMHIAIALGIHTIAFFGSTTEREIEFYGKGEALVGKVHCSPCYKRVCPTQEECMQQITVGQVLKAVSRGLGQRV